MDCTFEQPLEPSAMLMRTFMCNCICTFKPREGRKKENHYIGKAVDVDSKFTSSYRLSCLFYVSYPEYQFFHLALT